MRIAHVVTACAVLITTFQSATTVHSERWLQSKDYTLQQPRDNVTDISEITFTTLRPEVTTFSQKTHWKAYVGPRRGSSKGRSNRSMSLVLRGLQRTDNDRRRRQLHRFARASSKASVKGIQNLGRSYDLSDNHLDHHHIEIIQPVNAFGDGAVHIEPIYRVTKSKDLLSSLASVLARLINPPKPMGPLVGPFHFPGIGDKVYVRLIEPVKSNHLVIRLVTNLPVSEAEIPPGHYPLPPSGPANSIQGPSIGHESLALSETLASSVASAHHSNIEPSLASSDSLLSPSDGSSQALKSPHTFSEGPLASRTYRLNLKNGKVVNIQPVVPRGAIDQQPLSANKEGYSDWNLHPNQRNGSQPGEYFHPSSYHDPLVHVYQFHSNESSKDNLLSIEQSFDPVNISNFPIGDSISSGFQIHSSPTQIAEGQPRYSIEFASKKMRYLNLDGSVDTPGETNSKERFKQVPALKVARSIGEDWKSIKRTSLEAEGGAESPTKVKRSRRSNDSELPGTRGSYENHLRGLKKKNILRKLIERARRCTDCSSEENEKKNKINVDNSSATTTQARVTAKSRLHMLNLQRQLDLLKRSSIKSRSL